MKIRRVISLTVFLSFIALALSGIMLFVSPQGRVAYWAGWKLFGLSKEEYSAIHTTVMILFLVVGIWHIVLNWKPIVGYLKDRTRTVSFTRPEFLAALGLTLVFLLGPLLDLPPFSLYLDAGEEVKAYWEASSGSPPWGHAEENSLQRFCRGMEDYERLENQRMVVLHCNLALEALRSAGMEVEGLSQRLLEIAEVNGTTPQALAQIIVSVARPMTPDEMAARQPRGGAAGEEAVQETYHQPCSGLGRMTMAEYAQEYGYDLEEILAILRRAGLELDSETRLREEATRLGTDPEGLIRILNGGEGEG
jgi:hypothetical protein